MHLRRTLATIAAARGGLALAAMQPRLILTAAVLAGVALAAMPATAQAAPATAQAQSTAVQSTAAQPGPAVAGTVPVVADAATTSTHGVLVSQQGSESTLASLGCGWYLRTGYGPIARCTQVSGYAGRPGFRSSITGVFGPSTGWMPVHHVGWYSWNYGTIVGYTSLQTGYGPTVWATQRSGGWGRWGTVNLITGIFYPEGGWYLLA
jgi:hypothetical protein